MADIFAQAWARMGLKDVGALAEKRLTAGLKAAVQGMNGSLAPTTRQVAGLTGRVLENTRALAEGQRAAQGAAEALTVLGAAAAGAGAEAAAARRQLAGFDELHVLPGTAAGGKAESGSAAEGSGGKVDTAGKKSGTVVAEAAAATAALAVLQGKLAAFWAAFTAATRPAQEAWGAAWREISAAATAAWPGVAAAAQALWQNGLLPLLQYLGGSFVPGVVNSFSEAFAPILGGVISTGITLLGEGFAGFCTLVQSGMDTLIRPALALVLTVWQGLMEGIAAAWATYGQPLLAAAAEAFRNIGALVASLYTTVVEPVAAQVIALLGALWQNSLKPLWDQLVALFASLCLTVLNFWNSVLAPLLAWLTATVGPVFTAAFDAAATVVAVAVGLIADACSVVAAALQGVLNFVNTLFVAGWGAAWATVESSVANVWARIGNLVSNAVNGVIATVNGMVSMVTGAINAILSGIAKISGGALDFRVNAPQIPHLAAGGYVGAGQPTLAMIGDNPAQGEVVAPEGKLAEAVSAGVAAALAKLPQPAQQNGNGGEVPINIYLGGELLDRVILSSQNRVALRSGGRA
ncbi:MAG: hypothetical protein PHO10_03085 [Gemmiger sp.]|nr:hypothetical protein [Gemmiger sp.]